MMIKSTTAIFLFLSFPQASCGSAGSLRHLESFTPCDGAAPCNSRQVCVAFDDGTSGCECLEGYTGVGCHGHVNECQELNACDFPGAFCVDLDPSQGRYFCGCDPAQGFTDGESSPDGHGLMSCVEATSNEAEHCGTALSDIPSGDLRIRFNKITFPGAIPESATASLPLAPQDYPICLENAQWLRRSHAVSITLPIDCAECDLPLDGLILSVGGYPSHPSATNPHFWNELTKVVDVQEKRVADADPSTLLKLPVIWTGYDIHAVAEAVHDEYPGSIHEQLIKQLLFTEGAKLDRTILPSPNLADFVRGIVALTDLNTWSIATVGPHNFQVKWAGGRARPEEVAWWIFEGDEAELLSKGVPSNLIQSIKAMDLVSAEAFTAYPEGSPKHPSWPAMHSAASAASLWLTAVMDLTLEQRCEVMAVDYAIAYARTVAGVHYEDDNIAGLNLGREILKHKLPQYLAERYGSDPVVVTAKIEALDFDWNDYLEGPCFSEA